MHRHGLRFSWKLASEDTSAKGFDVEQTAYKIIVLCSNAVKNVEAEFSDPLVDTGMVVAARTWHTVPAADVSALLPPHTVCRFAVKVWDGEAESPWVHSNVFVTLPRNGTLSGGWITAADAAEVRRRISSSCHWFCLLSLGLMRCSALPYPASLLVLRRLL